MINCPHHLAGLEPQLNTAISTFYLELTTGMAHAAEEVGHYDLPDYYLLSDLSALSILLYMSCHVLIIIIYQEVSSLLSSLPGDNTE